MARYTLGAIMYIEDVLQKEKPSDEEKHNVKKYLKDVKSFPPTRKPKNPQETKFRNPKIEEIESGARLLVEFAGFEDIEPVALEKLKELFMYKFITMARQMATAERRKRDGIEIPYKSALEWTLKLNGVQSVLAIKTWYDATYLSRLHRLKENVSDGKNERLRDEPTPKLTE